MLYREIIAVCSRIPRIKLIKNSNSLRNILVNFLYNPLTDWTFHCTNKLEPLYNSLLVYSCIFHQRRSFLCFFNPLTPNGHYSGRTAPLTSKRCILYIYSTDICTEYFKHGIYSPLFSLQNAVCFIILTYLVPALCVCVLLSVYVCYCVCGCVCMCVCFFFNKFLYCCSILHYITQYYMLGLFLFTVIWLFILVVSCSWMFWLYALRPFHFSFSKSIELANVVNYFRYFFTISHFRTGQSSSLDV